MCVCVFTLQLFTEDFRLVQVSGCYATHSFKLKLIIMKAPQVLMPRWRCQNLHNIKLLIAYFCIIIFTAQTQRVGNDRP